MLLSSRSLSTMWRSSIFSGSQTEHKRYSRHRWPFKGSSSSSSKDLSSPGGPSPIQIGCAFISCVVGQCEGWELLSIPDNSTIKIFSWVCNPGTVTPLKNWNILVWQHKNCSIKVICIAGHSWSKSNLQSWTPASQFSLTHHHTIDAKALRGVGIFFVLLIVGWCDKICEEFSTF